MQNKREAVPVNPAGGQIEGLDAYAESRRASPARSTASRSSRRRRSPRRSSRKRSSAASSTSGCSPARKARPPSHAAEAGRRQRHRRRPLRSRLAPLPRNGIGDLSAWPPYATADPTRTACCNGLRPANAAELDASSFPRTATHTARAATRDLPATVKERSRRLDCEVTAPVPTYRNVGHDRCFLCRPQGCSARSLSIRQSAYNDPTPNAASQQNRSPHPNRTPPYSTTPLLPFASAGDPPNMPF